MPSNTEDLVIQLCTSLASEENLQVTVKESLKGGAIAGVCTVAGGVVGGPAGLAVGGAFGGCLAAYLAQDKFLPVSTVIQKMPAQKRRILANNVQELVASIRAEDIATLMALLAGDVMLRQRILRRIVQTVEEQANVRVSNFEM